MITGCPGAPKATHVYNRYGYDAETRAALDTWTQALTKILEPKEAGTVVSFEKRA